MKKVFLSIFIAIILTFCWLYFLFFKKLPDSITDQGFINYLLTNPNAHIGAFIGAMAASYFAFSPALMNIPKKIKEIKGHYTLSSKPTKAIGQVIEQEKKSNKTNLIISYNENQKTFEINNKAIQNPINTGDHIIVYYDPNNPKLAYLDLYTSLEEDVEKIKQSDILFKLIDITPKFDIGNNIFELSGEFYGGDFQGKKGSLIHELPKEDIAQYTPGKLFPCLISGTKDNYSVQILTSKQV